MMSVCSHDSIFPRRHHARCDLTTCKSRTRTLQRSGGHGDRHCSPSPVQDTAPAALFRRLPFPCRQVRLSAPLQGSCDCCYIGWAACPTNPTYFSASNWESSFCRSAANWASKRIARLSLCATACPPASSFPLEWKYRSIVLLCFFCWWLRFPASQARSEWYRWTGGTCPFRALVMGLRRRSALTSLWRSTGAVLFLQGRHCARCHSLLHDPRRRGCAAHCRLLRHL